MRINALFVKLVLRVFQNSLKPFRFKRRYKRRAQFDLWVRAPFISAEAYYVSCIRAPLISTHTRHIMLAAYKQRAQYDLSTSAAHKRRPCYNFWVVTPYIRHSNDSYTRAVVVDNVDFFVWITHHFIKLIIFEVTLDATCLRHNYKQLYTLSH